MSRFWETCFAWLWVLMPVSHVSLDWLNRDHVGVNDFAVYPMARPSFKLICGVAPFELTCDTWCFSLPCAFHTYAIPPLPCIMYAVNAPFMRHTTAGKYCHYCLEQRHVNQRKLLRAIFLFATPAATNLVLLLGRLWRGSSADVPTIRVGVGQGGAGGDRSRVEPSAVPNVHR